MTRIRRASDGSLILVSWHPKKSATWHWSVCLKKEPRGCKGYRLLSVDAHRKGQWHDYLRLPFGCTLIVSHQDFHKPMTAEVSE